MEKLSAKNQRWLKVLYIYAACVLAGCATVMTVMPFFLNPESGGELYGIMATIDFIDQYILVPGALGTFIQSGPV